MYKMWLLFLLSLVLFTSAVPEDLFLPKIENINGTYDGYRLSTTVIPKRYEININVPQAALTGGSTNYSGTVTIVFQVTQTTNTIRLHSLVSIADVTLTDANYSNIIISNNTVNANTETVEILIESNLSLNVDYLLTISYSAILDPTNMQGFYRSEYTATNGVKEYLATTQFQPTHARRAFPCFDEPNFKAIFALTLTYPLEFSAVANTPGIRTNTTTEAKTVFGDTPVMSTYLVAFTVSKFTCSSNNVPPEWVNYEVCSRPDFANARTLAIDSGNKILAALNTWTNYSYTTMGIHKMHQIAIPDFSGGAMENWGQVTYREYFLLYNESYTSNMYKQRIIQIIAHEFAHMWFGNLLTCDWWNYTFLNEGFARYFQYFLLSKIPDYQTYESEKQWIIEQLQTAFMADSYLNSAALTSNVWTPAQIRNKFDAISYQKGASILRMLENIMGSTLFQTSLRSYLVSNAYLTTNPEKLWNALNSNPAQFLPQGVNFNQFIDNWANKAGFPVISASLNGSNITLTQKRFLYNNSAVDSTQWYVPITFITENSTNPTVHWLVPNNTNNISGNFNNSWIIINHNSAGYYRVNYDHTLRERLASVLRTNHLLLTDINRAQIIDDALNLARAGQIKYSEAFTLLTYLKNETSYYPWYSAIRGLTYVHERFGSESTLAKRVALLLNQHLENIYVNVSTIDLNAVSHVDSLKWQLLWTVACRMENPTCISEVKNLFKAFKDNNTSINPNIRNVVYCNALRRSDNITSDWNHLWDRLHTVEQPHENIYILMALGCARNRELLSYYLDQSFNSSSIIRNQDLATVWSSVYTSSSIGLEVAFEKFRNNYTQIMNDYSNAVTLLAGIVDRFTTEAQLTQLQAFITQIGSNTTVGLVGSAALDLARQNLRWQSTVKSDLDAYFGIVEPSSATSFEISIFLLLVVAVVNVLNH